MKTLISVLLLSLALPVHAKTYNIKNEEALRMVEAMVYAGATFQQVGNNIKKETTYQPIVCRYSKTSDGILQDTHCYIGLTGIGGVNPPEFPRESLAFVQAIRNYAKEVLFVGLPAIQVDNVTCTMRMTPRKYTCSITVN
jgi:hypothetical protein